MSIHTNETIASIIIALRALRCNGCQPPADICHSLRLSEAMSISTNEQNDTNDTIIGSLRSQEWQEWMSASG
jgi:hypothetical protein